MKELVLSVIVPVYNTAPWLRRCLDSICEQSYRNLEIVCVNDGSTDDSLEILEEYAARDSRIRVVSRPNGGLSAARNTGLQHCTGEWVLGVDADDYVAPDVVERALALAEDGVDMVFFGVQMVDENGAALPDDLDYFALPSGSMDFSESVALQMNVCFCSKLWRRSLIVERQLDFPEGLVHEDEAFYYLAAPWVRRVACNPAIGYYYVQRQGSIMHSAASVLTTARKCARVLEYVQSRAGACHAPYYLCLLWRMYKQCFHHAPRQERGELAAIFRPWVPVAAPRGDYRAECISRPSGRWVRREPLRLVYCLFGVPVLARLFNGLKFIGWQFALWQVLRVRLLKSDGKA